jgi:hypothetical protein
MKMLRSYLPDVAMIAVACSFLGCQTTAPGPSATASAPHANAGRLTISRAANLGEMLVVTVDGGKPVTVRAGDIFTTSLSPGKHVVSAILQPNQLNLTPTKLNLNVEKGKSYAYTAMWRGDTLVLQP